MKKNEVEDPERRRKMGAAVMVILIGLMFVGCCMVVYHTDKNDTIVQTTDGEGNVAAMSSERATLIYFGAIGILSFLAFVGCLIYVMLC